MADFGGTGHNYWAWKFDARQLAETEKRVVRLTKERMAHGGAQAAAVQGTSGTWIAAALVKAGVPVILVRKPGESPHGQPIEGPCGLDVQRVVFVDDFIASGNTKERVTTALLRCGVAVVDVVCHQPDF